MRKTFALRLALVAGSVLFTLLAAEIALRARDFLRRADSAADSQAGFVRMDYHPRFGWISRPGPVTRGWTSNVDASGFRSNGRESPTNGRPIVAVGDSFVFGYEVEDGETWPAYLEGLLDVPVLNAGVGAYGIDQAYLRAELLLEEREPSVVILAFISDDITRTEASYYVWGKGWKPYFRLENGSLELGNVPVPQGPGPIRPGRFRLLREAMGHSRLGRILLERFGPRSRRSGAFTARVHDDGEAVCAELLAKLDGLARARGSRFVAVALQANEKIGGNRRLATFVPLARAKGVDVLDLATETLALEPARQEVLFRPGGHYSPEGNRLVAERLATYLRAGG